MENTEMPASRRIDLGDAGKELLLTLKRSISPLYWGNRQRTFNNGTVFFLETPKGTFAVTARHVYEGYASAALETPGLICQIDNMRFDPIQRLVSCGIQTDIATFALTPSELDQLGRTTIPWPPAIPIEGHSVLVAGMPGVARSNPDVGFVNFKAYLAIFRVDSLSERTISMIKPPDEELTDLLGKGYPPPSLDIGGMSGGPIAALMETPAGILTWSISGVIYEGHQAFDIIQGMRADLIQEDGIVRD